MGLTTVDMRAINRLLRNQGNLIPHLGCLAGPDAAPARPTRTNIGGIPIRAGRTSLTRSQRQNRSARPG
jgi:hypothetical protein